MKSSKEIILKPLITADKIRERLEILALEIAEGLNKNELIIIGLLKGSFMFMADMVRLLHQHKIPLIIDFISVSSYGSGTKSSGRLKMLYDPDAGFTEKHVLLVEDVVETGHTLSQLVRRFRERRPRSIEVVTLLHKRLASELDNEPRFVGFDAPRDFLVGYGLDFDEKYRHLPYIAKLKGQDV